MLFLFVELTSKYGITFNTFNARYLFRSIIIHTFAYMIKTFNDMKKYKVKDVLQMLKKMVGIWREQKETIDNY